MIRVLRINLFKNNPVFNLDKRQRFAVQTIIMTLGIVATQFILSDYKFILSIFLTILSYLLTVWSLREDIQKIEWITLFILPVLFTLSVSLFYFLLPARMIVRLLLTTVFAVSIYATLLVENIYNVAAERSIQLLRAAQSIGLMISLVTLFLITGIIFSLRLPFYLNFLLIVPCAVLLTLQSLWSVRLEPKLSRQLVLYSFIVGLGIGDLTIALSFWPVDISTASLLVAAGYYGSVGVIQQYFSEKLFKNTIMEYVYAFILTVAVAFLATYLIRE